MIHTSSSSGHATNPALHSTRRLGNMLRRISNVMLGRVVTLVLAISALALGVGTFAVLAGGIPLSGRPNLVFGLVLANLIVLLLLGAVLAGRLTRVWTERRRGSAGSRLHVRLVLLFSVVAVVPSILVAGFATSFFNFGIQSWFNDRVRTALEESLETARGYLDEHRNNIRGDASGMANDLSQAGKISITDPNAFFRTLDQQTVLRGLTEAVVFEPVTKQVIASAGLVAGLATEIPPSWAIDMARTGDVAVLSAENGTAVRAVVQLNSTPPLMLVIGRPVDPTILDHMHHVEEAVAEYERLDQNRSGLQITFVLIFALVALLVLSAAVLIGLVLANQIARPIGRLILAAERVRAGDLSVRVPEAATGDEIAGLSRAFNRMTGQLSAQRAELFNAYAQIDERRRFTEAVLSGVSAGVVGLNAAGLIELPNRAAGELLGQDLMSAVGSELAEIAQEFSPLIEAARQQPDRAQVAEIHLTRSSGRRTLLARIGAERHISDNRGGEASPVDAPGFVVTFDDITELQSAQRKAAWADVARRIAHEIKNPLTPIQLAAERLKRRFAREISSDPETFTQCVDTIVRHVGDIGRMVDEFSAFARMPQPVIKLEDVGRVARDALILQRSARPELGWTTDIPERGPSALCDRRLLGQALTNLLQNAADAVVTRFGNSGSVVANALETPHRQDGRIMLRVATEGEEIRLSVIDNGVGLPDVDRAHLTEPYVTHKPKGTGLGLAIVKKIMEDHGGRVVLADNEDGQGTVASLFLPLQNNASNPDGITAV
ncbi:Nitrogen regulation protein ntrY [Granulibacter bethesdensis]|uniref:histidine kinase n=1 Tax=Granulibacter bethesdensis TaxID=364410 RepID=A0AAC9KE41_9PROT|nr:PAS domain-containing sensor histidine kinase [Granulibacter bethesdensis]APH54518.1 Nitrogen regulation protein ntrY [Granulibacter bethesdensis]APH62104.1 Nitrogen regulation protein ntrY [Granulibacter bethesdensis]